MLVRGIVLGGLSAAGLSVLFLGTVALIAPPPPQGGVAGGASGVPVLPRAGARDAAPGIRPQPLTPREEARAPAGVPSDGVRLPSGSQFGRPPDDIEPALPLPDAGPVQGATSLAPQAPAAAPDAPAPMTDSAGQPQIVTMLVPVLPPEEVEAGPAMPVPVEDGAPAVLLPRSAGEGPSLPEVGGQAGVSDVVPGSGDPAVAGGGVERLGIPVDGTRSGDVPAVSAEARSTVTSPDGATGLDGASASGEAVLSPEGAGDVAAEALDRPAAPVADDSAPSMQAEARDGPGGAGGSDDGPAVGAPAPALAAPRIAAPVVPGDAPDVPRGFGAVRAGSAPVDEVATLTTPDEPAPPARLPQEIGLGVPVAAVPGAPPDPARPPGEPAIPAPTDAAEIGLVPADRVIRPPRAEPIGPQPAPPERRAPRVVRPGKPTPIVLDSAEPDQPGASGDAALERNAVAFAGDDRPLLSVVLMDDGDGTDPDMLAALDLPVTVALDARRSDAGARAARYRAAGHEVALMADALPAEGTVQDLEIALAGAVRVLPQAAVILDAGDRRLGRNRAAMPSLAGTGHGLVIHPGGLGSAVSNARRAGVAAAQISRVLDGGDEDARGVVRGLDRAAFEAAQDGRAIVLGHARAETVAALETWRTGNGAQGVQLAPLSAVLMSTQE